MESISISKYSSFIRFSITLLVAILLGNSVYAQPINDEDVYKKWFESLYEPGVIISDDTLLINEEASKLLNDLEFRKIIYPVKYTWEQTIVFIHSNDLRKAFWYMINLYDDSPQNKTLVLKSLMTYDKLLIMDEILSSIFFTYSMHDPEIESDVNGKRKITSPHLLEEKVRNLKEILHYLQEFRKLSSNSASNN